MPVVRMTEDTLPAGTVTTRPSGCWSDHVSDCQVPRPRACEGCPGPLPRGPARPRVPLSPRALLPLLRPGCVRWPVPSPGTPSPPPREHPGARDGLRNMPNPCLLSFRKQKRKVSTNLPPRHQVSMTRPLCVGLPVSVRGWSREAALPWCPGKRTQMLCSWNTRDH